MIERESDERLLENGHQRFGQIVGQRPQAFAESRTQNECLCDLIHDRRRESVVALSGFGPAVERRFQ